LQALIQIPVPPKKTKFFKKENLYALGNEAVSRKTKKFQSYYNILPTCPIFNLKK
jgi:hypothetical protein